MEVTQVSSVKPVGMIAVIHSTTLFFGRAGTAVTGPSTIISGWISQPSAHSTGGGASFGSPGGAPLSAHFAIVSISLCLRDRSFRYGPYLGSANHGGIFRVATAAFIALAHG